MESAREARRRKILERGSDRIAQITAAQTRSDTTPIQQSGQRNLNEGGARYENSHSNLSGAVQEENAAPFIKENISSNMVTAKDVIEEIEENVPPRTSNPPNPTDNKRDNGSKFITPWVFSPAEITQAFSDTETIRLVFVAFFTFLVIKGFISSKPMLILLLTDMAVIAGYIFLNKSDVKKHKKSKYNMPADKLGLTIELGFLAQRVFGAIFMDFCIYAVIVICGMGI